MEPDEKILLCVGVIWFVWFVGTIIYFVIRSDRQRRQWESFVADDKLESKLLDALRSCLPKGLTVSDFEIFPKTWGNDPLSIRYNSDVNPSHWMWVESMYIPGFLRILLFNTVAEIVFKGRKVEINRNIDFNEIIGALEELLTPMWPVQSFCIVAHKDSTTYVYKYFKNRPLPTNPTQNKLELELNISEVYQYLEH